MYVCEWVSAGRGGDAQRLFTCEVTPGSEGQKYSDLAIYPVENGVLAKLLFRHQPAQAAGELWETVIGETF
jgi:hypothetical protein